MWVYDGAQWIQASAASQAILTVYKFVATAGQTTFSGNDSEGKALSYTPGSVIITLNGPVITVPADVTASSGTSVVLTSAAVAGDEVNVYAFSTFNVADTYSQAAADAKFVQKDASGNVGIGGASNSTDKLAVSSAGQTRVTITNTANGVVGRLQTETGDLLIQTDTNHPVVFATNNGAPAMKLTTSGDFQCNSGYGSVATAY